MAQSVGTNARDTIAAIASAGGAGERSVLRISGPLARSVLERVSDARPGGRAALSATIDGGASAQKGDVLWMPGPRSFTGEDVAELHVLGHPGWTAAVLDALLRAGARLAEPGEFTRRAFENGRIDLTRAEGVAELVAAESRSEARAALALLTGGLESRVTAIRESLEDARTLAEASLDFDEADTGHVPAEEIAERAARATSAVDEALGWERRRAARSSRPTVVLGGAPNAGKSTLFNQLAEGEHVLRGGRAIVADEAGTTRDLKRATLRVTAGESELEAELVDTAGRLGDGFAGDGDLDVRADALAARAVRAADLVLWVLDAAAPPPTDWLGDADPGATIVVWNKTDRAGAGSAPTGLADRALDLVAVSAHTGAGIDTLRAAVADAFGGGGRVEAGGARAGLGARHLAALGEAAGALARAREAQELGAPLDLVAEELRAATDALDAITGRTAPEDLLTRIFARFCLGK